MHLQKLLDLKRNEENNWSASDASCFKRQNNIQVFSSQQGASLGRGRCFTTEIRIQRPYQRVCVVFFLTWQKLSRNECDSLIFFIARSRFADKAQTDDCFNDRQSSLREKSTSTFGMVQFHCLLFQLRRPDAGGSHSAEFPLELTRFSPQQPAGRSR